MWRCLGLAGLGLGFVAAVSAQASRASLTGTVSDRQGMAVTGAPIQLMHKETGATTRAFSTNGGQYVFKDLEPGLYELTIAMPCCAFQPFRESNLVLPPGRSLQLNIRLEEGGSLNTLGDDPGVNAARIRRRSVVPSGPAPRAADGKPDLSGVWLVTGDLFPEEPLVMDWAAALGKERVENNFKDHPHTRCLPGAPPVPGGASPFIAKFVQTPSLIVILFEDVPGFRQVFLDGRPHPAEPNPTWMGDSIGRWEGDTLTVETTGFNDRSWIGPYPHTEMLRMSERYRRVEFGRLEVDVTFEDPGTFRRPWNMHLVWNLAPQEELLEFVCENNKAERLVGK